MRKLWAVLAAVILCASAGVGVVVTTSAQATSNPRLVGDTTVEVTSDSNPSGNVQAWTYTAITKGYTTDLNIYVSSGNTATGAVVGLYATSGGVPTTLLATGSAASLTNGVWNDIPISSAYVTNPTVYAIAILGTGGGSMGFRDKASGSCSTYGSSSTSLTALPTTWSTGWTSSGYCPATAWVAGTVGTTTSSTTSTTTTSSTTSSAPVNVTPPALS